MALNFNGIDHQVSFGSPTTLDNLAASTYMFIYKPATLDSTFRYLYRKVVDPGGTNINHHDSDLEFTRGYGITNLVAFSTGDIISSGNCYISFFVDGGASVAPHIYHAQLGSLLTEPSYAQQDTPTGTLDTDASASLLVGFRDSTRRFIGDVSRVAVWAEAFSLADCQMNYWRFLANVNMRLFCELGYGHGTGTQLDWSGNGNDGTVTGAALANHPPIVPVLPRWSASIPVIEVAAVAASLASHESLITVRREL